MAKQDITLERGKTCNMSYTHPTAMSGGTLYFTLKPETYDDDADDSDALITKEVTSFTGAGTRADWTLTDSDTYIEPGKYYYDIVFEDASGESLPASWWGKATIQGRPTNRNV